MPIRPAPDYTTDASRGSVTDADPDASRGTSRLQPCRWWWRWFCRAPEQPIHHSWQCLVCRRITLD